MGKREVNKNLDFGNTFILLNIEYSKNLHIWISVLYSQKFQDRFRRRDLKEKEERRILEENGIISDKVLSMLCKARVNQQPPVHHPLEACSDSVGDEPQLDWVSPQ